MHTTQRVRSEEHEKKFPKTLGTSAPIIDLGKPPEALLFQATGFAGGICPVTGMTIQHKNKTFACLLAAAFGGFGVHRFYLHGRKDFVGWAHFATVPLSLIWTFSRPEQALMFTALPFILSALSGLFEALVIGLTADDKWDAKHNPGSDKQSRSGWPLAVLLVLTFGAGAITMIAVIARTFDLLFTGGAYG